MVFGDISSDYENLLFTRSTSTKQYKEKRFFFILHYPQNDCLSYKRYLCNYGNYCWEALWFDYAVKFDVIATCTSFDAKIHLLLLQSRWVVVASVIAVVVWRHDESVCWAVIGGILNAASSKLLKRLFNQQRPLTALGLKADPGMPSSHAQSLGFFSLYASLGCMDHISLPQFL
jgi:hypothetical protein